MGDKSGKVGNNNRDLKKLTVKTDKNIRNVNGKTYLYYTLKMN